MNNHSGKDFFIGAFIGGSLGALTALLFTTKQGSKIQQEVLNKYHDLEDSFEHHPVENQVKKTFKRKAKRAIKKTEDLVS